MNIQDFLKKRQAETEWMHINGFELGDPNINGQFSTLEQMLSFNSLFVDIGANKGKFAEKAIESNKRLKLLLFEPHPEHSKELGKLFPNHKVYDVALSNKKGEAEFFLYLADSENSTLFDRHEMMPSFVKQNIKTKVILDVLDSYLTEITSKGEKGVFIKIDVEGAEQFVFEGARKLLRTNTTMSIMFEYGHGFKDSDTTLKAIFHILDEYGFEFYRITPLGLEKIRFF